MLVSYSVGSNEYSPVASSVGVSVLVVVVKVQQSCCLRLPVLLLMQSRTILKQQCQARPIATFYTSNEVKGIGLSAAVYVGCMSISRAGH